jgi:sporulation protein YlmC with PRC-barrel domain
MSKRLSQLYGMDVYTEKAGHVGRVEDVILNLEKGEVMRLSLKSFKARTLPSDDVRRIIQEESIGYNDVVRAGDIIICRKNPMKEGKKTRKATRD